MTHFSPNIFLLRLVKFKGVEPTIKYRDPMMRFHPVTALLPVRQPLASPRTSPSPPWTLDITVIQYLVWESHEFNPSLSVCIPEPPCISACWMWEQQDLSNLSTSSPSLPLQGCKWHGPVTPGILIIPQVVSPALNPEPPRVLIVVHS